MAMGKRKGRQGGLWIVTQDLARSPGVHLAGLNLGLVMRQSLRIGTPRGLQSGPARFCRSKEPHSRLLDPLAAMDAARPAEETPSGDQGAWAGAPLGLSLKTDLYHGPLR